MIRAMIVDDDALVRLGLTDLLDSDDGIEVVAQATDGLHAIEQATAHRVDVALVDVRMPRMDGIAATGRLRSLPHPPAEILRAVHLVAAGSALLHPAARRLIDRYHHAGQPQATAARARLERLTPREGDVLVLLARGDTNAGIATQLNMRESTVKAHVSRILSALEVTNRVQAALLARDADLPWSFHAHTGLTLHPPDPQN
ncbi:response regulator transcription factor [Streptomyces hydrogenans]